MPMLMSTTAMFMTYEMDLTMVDFVKHHHNQHGHGHDMGARDPQWPFLACPGP